MITLLSSAECIKLHLFGVCDAVHLPVGMLLIVEGVDLHLAKAAKARLKPG